MVVKKDVINKLLESTLKFSADGHLITINQSTEDPIIKIDGETATPEDLQQYNHFVVPSVDSNYYGVTEMDFTGRYNVTDDDSINDITPEHVGDIVTIEGSVDVARLPEPVIDTGLFECKSCMRLHEVKQNSEDIRQPAVCTECGGRTFKLLTNESKFTESQRITVRIDTIPYPIAVMLTGSRCDYNRYDTGDKVIFRGVLMVDFKGKLNEYYLKYAEDITSWYGRTR